MANQTQDLAQMLIDRMHALQEEYQSLLDERAANRRTLRDLAAQGVLSAEHIAQVTETYPERAPRGSRLAEAA